MNQRTDLCWNCGTPLDFDTDGNGRLKISCPVCSPIFALFHEIWIRFERGRRIIQKKSQQLVDPIVPKWAENEKKTCECGGTITRKFPGKGRWPQLCPRCRKEKTSRDHREYQRKLREG